MTGTALRFNLPLLRTDPVATRQITWWSCALGYVVILAAVPVLAGGLYWLAVATLNDTGITRTAIGPALQFGENVVLMLQYSFLAAWMGALASVPVVIWARLAGYFGWGTAMLTGIAVVYPIMGIGGTPINDITAEMALPSALLGLAFWITIRLIHPSAFMRSQS